jgi:selenocysteine lyase/cysteine desulfurase
MGTAVDSKFSIATAREHFPALNKPQVYFDNAGGSQTLGSVIESIKNYLSSTNVQLGASYSTSVKSTSLYGEGYETAANYINATPQEVVLGSSTTQLFRNLSFALRFNRGDEIIISQIDHETNIDPWTDMAELQGLTVKWWKPKDHRRAKLEVDDLKDLLSSRTRFVACTHASNVLGTIHDIKAIAEAVHTVPGALMCVDGVAYAPHRPIDVRDLGVDFYAFSWYKVQ